MFSANFQTETVAAYCWRNVKLHLFSALVSMIYIRFWDNDFGTILGR